jgi:hypothetical protein
MRLRFLVAPDAAHGDCESPVEEREVRGLPWLLVWVIATALSMAAARAESVTARLQVSARVLPHVRLETLAPAVTSVRVTARDLQNGYVDVAHRYALRTNAPDRVRLQFRPRAKYARAVTIEGFGAAVRMQDEPVELSPVAGRDVAFEVRLWLVLGLEPGDYPAPIQVVAVVD